MAVAASIPVGEREYGRMVTIEELSIDPRYQRSLSQPRVKEMADDWDWNVLEPIKVSERPNGQLKILDGQHRVAAAILRGDIPELPAMILVGLTPEEEADIFIKGTTRRKSFNALEQWKAALAAGYEMETEINMVVEACGTQVNRNPTNQKGINAPVALIDVWKMGGVELLKQTLEYLIVSLSEKGKEPGGMMFSSGLIKGLGLWIGMYTDANDDGDLIQVFNEDRLLKRLQEDGVYEIMRKANAYRTIRGSLGQTMLSAIYYSLTDIYNKGLREATSLPDRRPDRRAVAQKYGLQHTGAPQTLSGPTAISSHNKEGTQRGWKSGG